MLGNSSVKVFSFIDDYTMLENTGCFQRGGQTKLERDDNDMDKTLKEYHSFLCGKYRKEFTIRNYFNVVKRFLEYTNNRVNYETVSMWNSWANNHYKRVNSLNSNINAINVYLKWLDKPDLCMKTFTPEESDEYSLSEDEFDKVLIESKQNIETALIFELLRHLIRPSAVINIKIKHRNQDMLYIADTKNSGKTGSGYVVMSQRLQELWDRYLMFRPIPLPEYKDYLLIDNEVKWRGCKFMTTLPIRNRIIEIGHSAGINKRVKPYTIKRSSITLMLDKNSKYFVGDPKIVQKMARHRKLETTMKYDRRDENDIRNYHKSLNNISEKTGDSLSVGNIYTLHINKNIPRYVPRFIKNREEDDDSNCCYSFSIISFLKSLFFKPTGVVC